MTNSKLDALREYQTTLTNKTAYQHHSRDMSALDDIVNLQQQRHNEYIERKQYMRQPEPKVVKTKQIIKTNNIDFEMGDMSNYPILSAENIKTTSHTEKRDCSTKSISYVDKLKMKQENTNNIKKIIIGNKIQENEENKIQMNFMKMEDLYSKLLNNKRLNKTNKVKTINEDNFITTHIIKGNSYY